MNRRYSLASLALAALGLLSACSKSDIYAGEYSKDGYYNESRVIYFPNSGADTIAVQNLALLEDNNGKIPLTFQVNLLGKLSSSPLSYKVELDKSRSTATSGEQFDALQDSYTIAADSIKGSFTLQLNRSKISTVQQENGKYIVTRDGVRTLLDALSDMEPGDVPLLKYDTITMHLSPTADLRTAVNKRNTVVLCVTNQLEIPFWWGFLQDVYLGKYSEGKYRMLINAYGLPKNGEDPIQHALYSSDANIQYPLLLRLEKYMDEHGEEKPAILVRLLAQYR
ncbi:DUF4843 domain-containing protein [uncultured Porphyromonas sp.]|uniref:DUF4843 domain-containing protein n=1 Tax=uncultured Porphyromonas sp. TaxID=159274 RepID=UPI00261FFB93|nr:DUF4843 domain-containing protein [uncultured Porphyromonas sp.]